MFVILQVKAALCQLCWSGLRYVVPRDAGLNRCHPLRHLGFRGVESAPPISLNVMQITHVDGHTDASACLVALGSVTFSSLAVSR